MAVLSRNNWLSSQRVDLADLQAIDSYMASDLRAFVRFMCGTQQSYILSGLKLKSKIGSTATFEVKNCAIYLPNEGAGSFFIGSPDAPDVELQIQSGETAIYVEAQFTRQTATPVTRAKWDETAVTSEYPAGQEFTTSAHAQDVMMMTITKNVVGFSAGAVPICIFNTVSETHKNCRNMFFSVGTGGSTPNQTAQYPWSSNRGLPVLEGTEYGDLADSPFRQYDGEGVMNDSAFTCFKDFHDALLTVLAEMRGVAVWYASAAQSSYVANSNLNQLMFDSTGGMHMEPDADTYIKWVYTTKTLQAAGAGPIRWAANYGYVRWELGGTFVSPTNRAFATTLFSRSPLQEGENLYLSLIREVRIGSQAPVQWNATAPGTSGWPQTRVVSGAADSFTGVAVGDWIRKESESASRYYQVEKLYKSDSEILDVEGQVADSTYTCAYVSRDIDVPSTEPLRYFRQKYSNAELIIESAIDKEAGTHYDANKFWIGTCHGTEFYLRDIGMLLPGGDNKGDNNRNQESLTVQFSGNVRFYDGKLRFVDSDGKFSTTAGTELLRITRRFISADETNTYGQWNLNSVLNNTDLTFAEGSVLWARLEDVDITAPPAPAVLTSADVTLAEYSSYEVRAFGSMPENTYANRNIYPLCKCVGNYLEFCDGTLLGLNGICSRADFEATGAASFGASMTYKVKDIVVGDSPYYIDYHDDYYLSVTLSTGNITINLPNFSDPLKVDIKEGVVYRIKDAVGLADDLGDKIVVQATGGATIDGAAAFEIDSPYMEVGFMKVGSNWAAV